MMTPIPGLWGPWPGWPWIRQWVPCRNSQVTSLTVVLEKNSLAAGGPPVMVDCTAPHECAAGQSTSAVNTATGPAARRAVVADSQGGIDGRCFLSVVLCFICFNYVLAALLINNSG